MSTAVRLYRGLEVYPLVYPHRPTSPGAAHNYDEGFDAAVRIQQPAGAEGVSRSRVFRLESAKPFQNAGDARRASTAYAEQLIDACPDHNHVLDMAL